MVEKAQERSLQLEKAIAELKVKPYSPGQITNYWRVKLQTDGKGIVPDIFVPYCNWTEEEIKEPMVDIEGKEIPSMIVYVPQELTGEKGLVRLELMYPKMKTLSAHIQKTTSIQDASNANKESRWVKVEATVDAPNLDTTEEDLKKHAKKQGYLGQRKSTYILASQLSKDLTGYHLDNNIIVSRLLNPYSGSVVVDAGFLSVGNLRVFRHLDPQVHLPYMGGRFEEVKKT